MKPHISDAYVVAGLFVIAAASNDAIGAFVVASFVFAAIAATEKLLLICALMQMGMMKELIRGPIKCCETLAQDTLYQFRAEALLHHSEFHPVENVSIARENLDTLPGTSLTRFVGSPKTHTERKLLVNMLRVFLDGDFEVLKDLGWEPDGYSQRPALPQIGAHP